MIYATATKVLNLSPNALWGQLEKFLAASLQGKFINDCHLLESYYDGFLREYNIANEPKITERVFLLKDQQKIIMRLQDHPLYIGETIWQIVAPDEALLSDKRVLLVIVLAWRIRPGIIEAPMLPKQALVDNLMETVS